MKLNTMARGHKCVFFGCMLFGILVVVWKVWNMKTNRTGEEFHVFYSKSGANYLLGSISAALARAVFWGVKANFLTSWWQSSYLYPKRFWSPAYLSNYSSANQSLTIFTYDVMYTSQEAKNSIKMGSLLLWFFFLACGHIAGLCLF